MQIFRLPDSPDGQSPAFCINFNALRVSLGSVFTISQSIRFSEKISRSHTQKAGARKSDRRISWWINNFFIPFLQNFRLFNYFRWLCNANVIHCDENKDEWLVIWQSLPLIRRQRSFNERRWKSRPRQWHRKMETGSSSKTGISLRRWARAPMASK